MIIRTNNWFFNYVTISEQGRAGQVKGYAVYVQGRTGHRLIKSEQGRVRLPKYRALQASRCNCSTRQGPIFTLFFIFRGVTETGPDTDYPRIMPHTPFRFIFKRFPRNHSSYSFEAICFDFRVLCLCDSSEFLAF